MKVTVRGKEMTVDYYETYRYGVIRGTSMKTVEMN